MSEYLFHRHIMNNVILASASPRRKELLAKLEIPFTVLVSDCEEVVSKTFPGDVVGELSALKADAVYQKIVEKEVPESLFGIVESREDFLVIGSDTVVAYENQILGKPHSKEEAYDMLSMLSDKSHAVYTGVTFVYRVCGEKKMHTFYEKTEVTFYPLGKEEIEAYIATGDPMDKAGSYGIQGNFAKHVKGICGDYNNVVGLPVSRLYTELKECGLI